jgi:hypothetical protein
MSKTSTFSHSVLQGDSRFVLTHDDRRWPVVAAGVLWLVAGLTAGYWVLQVLGRSDLQPVSATPLVMPPVDRLQWLVHSGTPPWKPSRRLTPMPRQFLCVTHCSGWLRTGETKGLP